MLPILPRVISAPWSSTTLGMVSNRQVLLREDIKGDIPHVKARHRLPCATGLDVQGRVILDVGRPVLAGVRHQGNTRDWRTGLGRPPVINHMGALCAIFPEQVLVHGDDGRLRSLSGQEQGPETLQSAAFADAGDEGVVGVIFADGPQGRRGREHGVDLVFLNQAPESGCVWGADGLALVEEGSSAGEERPVERIAVRDDPTNVAEAAHLPSY